MTVENDDDDDDKDDEGEEDEAILLFHSRSIMALGPPTIVGLIKRQRLAMRMNLRLLIIRHNSALFDNCLKWNVFMAKFRSRTEFQRHIRMSAESFEKLVGYVRQALKVNTEMARR